uniref:ATP synthase F0 subunit 8 n=1 Tax=Lepidostoma inops TaxID=2904890 RepID=A0A9E8RSM3_9NEOP|nr:ATP synthase F0 subunit 8 [Lepidostoma inops]UZZ44094.1 ATP synthase F0 subunit 8 [Lepidostoma inops]
MPQMMPLNWTLLFLITNVIFFTFLIFTYFNYPSKINLTNNTSIMNQNDTQSIHNFWPIY